MVQVAYLGLAELVTIDPVFDHDDPVMVRYEMIREFKAMSEPAEVVAPKYGYSKSQLYIWLRRFEQSGLEGLKEEKRGPKNPRKVTDEIEMRVIQLRKKKDLSITELSSKLEEDGIILGPTTIDRILTKHGIAKKKRGRKSHQHQ